MTRREYTTSDIDHDRVTIQPTLRLVDLLVQDTYVYSFVLYVLNETGACVDWRYSHESCLHILKKQACINCFKIVRWHPSNRCIGQP